MKRSFKAVLAFAVACAAIPAFAADLTGDERSELRERADRLNSERQRNPNWDGGTRRVQTRGDVTLNQNQGEVKTPRRGEVKTKVKGGKKVKREPMKKRMKHAAKEVPGALVRKR